MANLRKEYTEKMAQLEMARRKEAVAIRSASQKEIDAARAETARIAEEMQGIQNKYQTATTQITQLKAEVASEREAKNRLEALLQSTRGEMTRLRQDYERKIGELNAARQKEVEAIRSNSQAAIAAAKKETARIEKELAAVEGKYKVLSTQNSQLSAELSSERDARAALQNQLVTNQSQMTQLRRDYEQKMQQLATARQKEMEALRTQSATAIAAAQKETATLERVEHRTGPVRRAADAEHPTVQGIVE